MGGVGWRVSRDGGERRLLMKDVVLLAVSFYLLKQGVTRAAAETAWWQATREIGRAWLASAVV